MDGYAGKPPPKTVWIQLQPLVNPIWFESMIHKGIKEKSLDEITAIILEESSGRNPLHQWRIELMRVRKTGSHGDFFYRLEENMSLIEFDKLTKEALLINLFLEQSDETMGRMAQDILVKTPAGDINLFRQEIW